MPKVSVTRYTINPFRVADGIRDCDVPSWLVTIEYRGLPPCIDADDGFENDPKWSVQARGESYRLQDGKLSREYEPQPSSRTGEYKKLFRMTYREALLVAAELAKQVREEVLERIAVMNAREEAGCG